MRLTGVAKVRPGKCIICGGRCESACPAKAIQMTPEGEPTVIEEKCIGCRKCEKACPADVFEMYFTPEQLAAIAERDERRRKAGATAESEGEREAVRADREYKGVWVFVEQTDGEPARVSWELLGVGAELAKALDAELCSVVIGHEVEELCLESFAYGASRSYLVDGPLFRHYRTEPYFRTMCDLVRRYKPEIVLVGATGQGRDLAGAIATELKTGLTADCTGLAIDDEGPAGPDTVPPSAATSWLQSSPRGTGHRWPPLRPRVMSLPKRN